MGKYWVLPFTLSIQFDLCQESVSPASLLHWFCSQGSWDMLIKNTKNNKFPGCVFWIATLPFLTDPIFQWKGVILIQLCNKLSTFYFFTLNWRCVPVQMSSAWISLKTQYKYRAWTLLIKHLNTHKLTYVSINQLTNILVVFPIYFPSQMSLFIRPMWAPI